MAGEDGGLALPRRPFVLSLSLAMLAPVVAVLPAARCECASWDSVGDLIVFALMNVPAGLVLYAAAKMKRTTPGVYWAGALGLTGWILWMHGGTGLLHPHRGGADRAVGVVLFMMLEPPLAIAATLAGCTVGWAWGRFWEARGGRILLWALATTIVGAHLLIGFVGALACTSNCFAPSAQPSWTPPLPPPH